MAVEDGWALEEAAGWVAPNKFEVAAGAAVLGAAVLVVAAEVAGLNRLGAAALLLEAAVVVCVPDSEGKREEVAVGVDVACVVLPSPPKRFAPPVDGADGAAAVEAAV